MKRTLSIPVVVLIAVVALVLGTFGSATAASLTKGQVKKIAAKVVDTKAATLTVAKAASATKADSATTATTANGVVDNSITGAKVVDRSLSNADISVYYAVVNADSTIFASSGGIAGAKISTGTYSIAFGLDITQCAITATLGPNASTFGSTKGEVDVAPRSGEPTAAFVQTTDSTGTPTDKPFHMVVVC